MKRIVLIASLVCLAATAYAIDFSVEARTDLFYTSYKKNSAYEAMAATQTLTAVNVYEKLRLKAGAEAESVKFNFDGRVYVRPNDPVLEYAIDSLYFSYENGSFVLYAGKQRMKWGTGYFWNPTDNLQPAKNIFRTTEDLEGILALRAEYSNDIVTPSIIIIPAPLEGSSELGENFKAAVQLYKLLWTVDLYINFVRSYFESTSGVAISWDNGLFVLNAEACRKADSAHMWDFSWGGSKVIDFVVGASKTMGDFFLNVEYYRKNSGISNSDYAYDILFYGIGEAMSKQNYLAYSANYTWDQKLGISITGMHGLDDGTSYIFPSLSWMENQNFDVQLSLLQNLTQEGVKEGNYSTPVYSTVELRLNAYF